MIEKFVESFEPPGKIYPVIEFNFVVIFYF